MLLDLESKLPETRPDTPTFQQRVALTDLSDAHSPMNRTSSDESIRRKPTQEELRQLVKVNLSTLARDQHQGSAGAAEEW